MLEIVESWLFSSEDVKTDNWLVTSLVPGLIFRLIMPRCACASEVRPVVGSVRVCLFRLYLSSW